MSASTEHIIEQIEALEKAICIAEAAGQDSSHLKTDLRVLQRKLATCNEALTEQRQILKG